MQVWQDNNNLHPFMNISPMVLKCSNPDHGNNQFHWFIKTISLSYLHVINLRISLTLNMTLNQFLRISWLKHLKGFRHQPSFKFSNKCFSYRCQVKFQNQIPLHLSLICYRQRQDLNSKAFSQVSSWENQACSLIWILFRSYFQMQF